MTLHRIRPPWLVTPAFKRQQARRARLKRKGLTPRSKDELRALAATIAPSPSQMAQQARDIQRKLNRD